MKKNTILTSTVFLVLTAVTIYFSFNASALDNHATQSLDSISEQLKSFTDYTINISGHTDNIGSDSYNYKLSEQRVIAVKNYLVSKNVDSVKMKFNIYGEFMPAVPNTSDSNCALNRRVELTIIGQKINISLPQTTLSGQQNKDSIKPQKQDSIAISSRDKEVKKKKNKKRLIWTGWKTGFHWDTPGKN